MNWWRALLGMGGAACIFFAFASLEDDWVTAPEQRPVQIATLPCDTALQASSTGFVIDDRTVVTVAHAIFGSRDHAVRDSFGRWHRSEVIRLDLERDIAVLRVGDLRATTLERAAPRRVADWQGLSVTMLDGAATGTAHATIERRVRMRTEVVGDRDQQASRSGFEVNLDIAPGDSGAALIDHDGRLVAMQFARSTSRLDVSWATAVDEIDAAPGPVAEWSCDPAFDASLVLEPVREPRLP